MHKPYFPCHSNPQMDVVVNHQFFTSILVAAHWICQREEQQRRKSPIKPTVFHQRGSPAASSLLSLHMALTNACGCLHYSVYTTNLSTIITVMSVIIKHQKVYWISNFTQSCSTKCTSHFKTAVVDYFCHQHSSNLHI